MSNMSHNTKNEAFLRILQMSVVIDHEIVNEKKRRKKDKLDHISPPNNYFQAHFNTYFQNIRVVR